MKWGLPSRSSTFVLMRSVVASALWKPLLALFIVSVTVSLRFAMSDQRPLNHCTAQHLKRNFWRTEGLIKGIPKRGTAWSSWSCCDSAALIKWKLHAVFICSCCRASLFDTQCLTAHKWRGAERGRREEKNSRRRVKSSQTMLKSHRLRTANCSGVREDERRKIEIIAAEISEVWASGNLLTSLASILGRRWELSDFNLQEAQDCHCGGVPCF